MTGLFLFFGLFVALLAGAVTLALTVLLGRSRALSRLGLSAFLVVLAIGVWLVALREPLPF